MFDLLLCQKSFMDFWSLSKSHDFEAVDLLVLTVRFLAAANKHGPIGNRTRASSMPWMQSTTGL